MKAKFKAPADAVSVEGPLPGSQALSSYCVLNGGGGEGALVSFSSYKDTKPIHSSRHPILAQQLPKQEGRGSSNTNDLRLTCLSLDREEISFPVALGRLPFISQ